MATMTALTFACFTAMAPAEERRDRKEEHGESERGEHSKRERGEHGSEKGEEAGTDLSLKQKYDKVRNGARLILAYNGKTNSFEGTVENVTKKTLERVRVEVHTSNGKEIGPTKPRDLKPGKKMRVSLKAKSKNFDSWSAHAEVGNEEHGEGAEGEHGKRERGEHEREGKGKGEHR